MSFKMPFDPAKSFKKGDHVRFTCGGEREGVVFELAPEYFIIGSDKDGKDPSRSENQWIFYRSKDYDKISHLVIINGV